MPVNWSVFSFDERQRDGIFLTARRGKKWAEANDIAYFDEFDGYHRKWSIGHLYGTELI